MSDKPNQASNDIIAQMCDISKEAIKKLENESKDFEGRTNNKESAIHTYVCNVLIDFCNQSADFADIVLKTKRTLSDCCRYCVEGVGRHISDIDVYRRAVKFYFPDAEVHMNMSITTGDKPAEDYINKEAEKPKKTQEKKKTSKTKSVVESKKDEIKTEQKSSNKDVKPIVNTLAEKKVRKKKKSDDNIIQLSLF